MSFFSWVRFRSGEEAQTMAEYAVVLGVITPILVLAYAALSRDIGSLYDKVTALFG